MSLGQSKVRALLCVAGAATVVVGGCIGPQPSKHDGYDPGLTAPPPPLVTHLRGVVRNARTGAVVESAFVSIDSTVWMTRSDGSYTLQNLRQGSGMLTTVRAGFDTARTQLALQGGDRVFNVSLTPRTP